MKKVVLGMMLCVLAGCQESKVESFDVDRELDYCASQVSKALDLTSAMRHPVRACAC